ncbi:MAG: HipA domain-containing protein [Bdellovibrionales bacterium]|nr:HipA domain-containing protein [Bdellovibrionales bacterium]
MKKCFICYQPLNENSQSDYHQKCSKRFFNTANAPKLEYKLDEINSLAKQVVKQKIAIPGVQPKLSLTFNQQKNSSEKRLTIIGLWDGLFILKPPSKEFPQLPENEDLTMHLAKLCGITTAEHALIRFSSGEIAYISKRFDRKLYRKKVIKRHQEDLCQILGLLTENKYNSSHEKIAKQVLKHTTNTGLELISLFKLVVFCFLTGNSDMHLKNFSFVYNDDESISLSPAYDLLSTQLVLPKDQEDLALTLCGKKKNLTKNDFYKFAAHCQLNKKVVDNIFSDFTKALEKFPDKIISSFLSEDMAKNYLNIVYEKAERLKL